MNILIFVVVIITCTYLFILFSLVYHIVYRKGVRTSIETSSWKINTPCLSFNVSCLHSLSYTPLLSTESTEVQVPVQGDGSGHATYGQQAGVWGVNGAVAVGGVLPGHHELLLQNRLQAVAHHILMRAAFIVVMSDWELLYQGWAL